MPNRTAATLSANVRAEMSRRNVRQLAVARALGLSQASVSSRLRGDMELSVSELHKIARLLDVRIESLLAGTEAADMRPAESAAS